MGVNELWCTDSSDGDPERGDGRLHHTKVKSIGVHGLAQLAGDIGGETKCAYCVDAIDNRRVEADDDVAGRRAAGVADEGRMCCELSAGRLD